MMKKKEAIYWLAYQSLKSVDENDPTQKRLIWAYDESQTIHSPNAIAPNAEVIFGKIKSNIGGESGGIYSGNIRKAYDMERCYRTPGNILTTAYALGTGLLREGDIIHPRRMRKKTYKLLVSRLKVILEVQLNLLLSLAQKKTHLILYLIYGRIQ